MNDNQIESLIEFLKADDGISESVQSAMWRWIEINGLENATDPELEEICESVYYDFHRAT